MFKHKTEDVTYAYLPEDLLLDLLKNVPDTAAKLGEMMNINKSDLVISRDILEKKDLIRKVQDDCAITSDLIAVDGANIVEHMTGSDLIMAIAVGVEGLTQQPSSSWKGSSAKQYYHWQDALPHHVANSRLSQGIMFLMELSILANAQHNIRIMDGSHITSILKINSLLSAKDEEFADEAYVDSLSNFLMQNYDKIIPDIPDIIDAAFKNSNIIGLAKYSSSRDIVDSYLKNFKIPSDDKTFFSLVLNENEYTRPISVGQSQKEVEQWEMAHIKCNLNIKGLSDNEKEDLNKRLDETIDYFRPKKGGNLYYLYYKPFQNGISYRIEIKKELAENQSRLEQYLHSLKRQTFYPDILEPYPQYLADLIAKNISFGMKALKQAIRSNKKLSQHENFHLLLSYRSK